MILKICTEAKNEGAVFDIVSDYYDAFAVYTGTGSWKGEKERCLMIEIAVLPGEEARSLAVDRWIITPRECTEAKRNAREIATRIKLMNKQEAVLVEFIQSTNELI